MTKTVIVLGVPHQIQGQKFPDYVKDPEYNHLVEQYIGLVDFVFEEATGRGPSIAEDLSKSLFEAGRYLDVDPSVNERPSLGIKGCTSFVAPFPGQFTKHVPSHSGELIDEHGKREKQWLKRMQAESFEQALFICGIAHSFSFAFRLQCAGINVEVYHYLPFEKLCRHNRT